MRRGQNKTIAVTCYDKITKKSNQWFVRAFQALRTKLWMLSKTQQFCGLNSFSQIMANHLCSARKQIWTKNLENLVFTCPWRFAGLSMGNVPWDGRGA